MKWICLECLQEVENSGVERKEDIVVKGKKITINAKKAYCPCCGEEMVSDEATDYNLSLAYTEYRKKEHLLFPDEIKKIRQQYALTQVGFARILGLGDKTIARYETGAIQDVAYDNLIRLCEDPVNFQKLWTEHKDLLTAQDRVKSEAALKQLLSKSEKSKFVFNEKVKYQFGPFLWKMAPFENNNCISKGRLVKQ